MRESKVPKFSVASSRCLGLALAGSLAMLVSAPGWAGIYKCTDGTGRKTYSDKPCDGQVEVVDPTRVGFNTTAPPKASVPVEAHAPEARAPGSPRPGDSKAQPLTTETRVPAPH